MLDFELSVFKDVAKKESVRKATLSLVIQFNRDR